MNVTNASAATGMSRPGCRSAATAAPRTGRSPVPPAGGADGCDDRSKVRVVQQHGAEVVGDVEHRLDGVIGEGAAQVAQALRLVLDHRVEQGGLVLEVAVDRHRVHIRGRHRAVASSGPRPRRVDDLDRRLDDALVGQPARPARPFTPRSVVAIVVLRRSRVYAAGFGGRTARGQRCPLVREVAGSFGRGLSAPLSCTLRASGPSGPAAEDLN